MEEINKNPTRRNFLKKIGKAGIGAGVAGALLDNIFTPKLFARQSSITIAPNSFVSEASYIIFKDRTTIKARNISKGTIEFSGTDASTVIQNAINALTSRRTWKEKVVLKGDFELTKPIYIASYTILEILGILKPCANFQTANIGPPPAESGLRRLIIGSNIQAGTPRPTYIDIIGATLDGNKANQPTPPQTNDWFLIFFYNGENINIKNVKGINSKAYGMDLDNCANSYVENVRMESCDADGFYNVHSEATYINCRGKFNSRHGFSMVERGGVIIGGEYDYNGQDGIILQPIAAESLNCYDTRVIAPYVHHNGRDGIRLAFDSPYSALNNNLIGVVAKSNNSCGINEVFGCNYNSIIGGAVGGNTLGDILKSGANTVVRLVQGYVTENNVLSGTFAIDSTGVKTVTIAHGLSYTPALQDIALTVVENTDVDDWAYNLLKVESIDATNVTVKINVSTASATEGATARIALRIGKA